MNNSVAGVAFALISLGLSGCVIIDGEHEWESHNSAAKRTVWEQEQQRNREAISTLALQTERAAVLAQLGVPSFSEAFRHNGEEVHVLYYRTQRIRSDGATSKDETTPLVFRNERLMGWGEQALMQVR